MEVIHDDQCRDKNNPVIPCECYAQLVYDLNWKINLGERLINKIINLCSNPDTKKIPKLILKEIAESASHEDTK